MSLAEIVERGTNVPLSPYETFHEREAAVADSLVTCADGTQLSVIAGFGCYSTPRSGWGGVPVDYPGPFTALEVMSIDSEVPESWAEYETGGVYAHVPVEVVRGFIESHGGEREPCFDCGRMDGGCDRIVQGPAS